MKIEFKAGKVDRKNGMITVPLGSDVSIKIDNKKIEGLIDFFYLRANVGDIVHWEYGLRGERHLNLKRMIAELRWQFSRVSNSLASGFVELFRKKGYILTKEDKALGSFGLSMIGQIKNAKRKYITEAEEMDYFISYFFVNVVSYPVLKAEPIELYKREIGYSPEISRRIILKKEVEE